MLEKVVYMGDCIKSDSPSLYEWSEVRGQRLSDELMVNGASKC